MRIWQAAVILLVYVCPASIATILFAIRRRRPEIAVGSVSLTVTESCAAILFILTVVSQGLAEQSFPNAIFFWLMSILMSLFVMCVVARAIRVYLIYEWNRAQLLASLQLDRGGRLTKLERLAAASAAAESMRSPPAALGKDSRSRSPPLQNSSVQPTAVGLDPTVLVVVGLGTPPVSLEERAREMARLLAMQGSAVERRDAVAAAAPILGVNLDHTESPSSSVSVDVRGVVLESPHKKAELKSGADRNPEKRIGKWIWTCIGAALLLQILLNIILTVLNPVPVSFAPAPYFIMFTYHLIPMYVVIVIYLVASPFLIYKLRRIEDAHGIRNGLRWLLGLGVPLYVAWFIFSFARRSLNPTWRDNITANFCPMIVFLADCITSVIIPVLRTYRIDRKQNSLSPNSIALPSYPMTRFRSGLAKLKAGRSSPSPSTESAVTKLVSIAVVTKKRQEPLDSCREESVPSPQPLDHAQFVLALRDPVTYDAFKKFCAKDFNIEAVLLFESLDFLSRAVDAVESTVGGLVPDRENREDRGVGVVRGVWLTTDDHLSRRVSVSAGRRSSSSNLIASAAQFHHTGAAAALAGFPSRRPSTASSSLPSSEASSSSPSMRPSTAVVGTALPQPAPSSSLSHSGGSSSISSGARTREEVVAEAKAAVVSQCLHIYTTFLARDALWEVRHLSFSVRREVTEWVERGMFRTDMFDEIRKETVSFLLLNVYPRFLASV
ncbi:hypothetical protein DFJ73DRAFT_90164 [Zopfochytrium polystomum]|nr:hypothetical protein DFJ73DRAFT_90164 [Zopfochytrium polystomum]